MLNIINLLSPSTAYENSMTFQKENTEHEHEQEGFAKLNELCEFFLIKQPSYI
jgi:hypothetical protein